MATRAGLTVGSTVRITRANHSETLNAFGHETAPVSRNATTETFDARITRTVETENGQQCYGEEIDGDRTQAFTYPSAASFDIEVIERKNPPSPISFEVAADKIVRGHQHATGKTTEHIAEWDGQQFVVRRKDRKYRFYEVTATPEGDVMATLETNRLLSLADESKEGIEAESRLTEAYREEMRAVARALRNEF